MMYKGPQLLESIGVLIKWVIIAMRSLYKPSRPMKSFSEIWKAGRKKEKHFPMNGISNDVLGMLAVFIIGSIIYLLFGHG